MKTPHPAEVHRQARKDRLLRELVHDTYKSKRKLPEPSACPDCGAVYHHGRWEWGERPAGAHEERCPACRRIRDRVPAGFLHLSGDFLRGHRDEILHLVRHVEAREKAEHPLERIMAIEDEDGALLITFTEAHLARGVGEALHRAYKGELHYAYTEEESMLRVSWRR